LGCHAAVIHPVRPFGQECHVKFLLSCLLSKALMKIPKISKALAVKDRESLGIDIGGKT